MSPYLVLAPIVFLVSLWGAAFLLRLWHDDREQGTNGWPLSRVVAYLAIAGTLAASVLAGLTYLRVADFPNYREIQAAFAPVTPLAILVLLLLFPILAAYLRVVRASGYMTSSERSGLATEASVREAIAAARDAYHEANSVNNKIASLTELVAGKEDRA